MIYVSAQNSTKTTTTNTIDDCYKLFKKSCTPCLRTLYDLAILSNPWDSESSYTCEHFKRFKEMFALDDPESIEEADYEFINSEVKKFCTQSNPCPTSFSTSGYKRIQQTCGVEAKGVDSVAELVAYF
ncbi:hypothetical protein G9A89_017998 [Geosiphon pyriformis]|nr:hypothetical protein G9A89_017998 [Geosiphon pyriformis]